MIEIKPEDSIKNITAALIGFHVEVGKVTKNADNYYGKGYGDINAYLDVISQPLINNGLTIIQMPITGGLMTKIMHTSGESIESKIEIDLPKDIQKIGAALTYLRRYSLAAMLLLNAEDDDGNSISHSPQSDPVNKSLRPKQTDQKAIDNMKTLELERRINMAGVLYKQIKDMGQVIDKETAFIAQLATKTAGEIGGFNDACTKKLTLLKGNK